MEEFRVTFKMLVSTGTTGTNYPVGAPGYGASRNGREEWRMSAWNQNRKSGEDVWYMIKVIHT